MNNNLAQCTMRKSWIIKLTITLMTSSTGIIFILLNTKTNII